MLLKTEKWIYIYMRVRESCWRESEQNGRKETFAKSTAKYSVIYFHNYLQPWIWHRQLASVINFVLNQSSVCVYLDDVWSAIWMCVWKCVQLPWRGINNRLQGLMGLRWGVNKQLNEVIHTRAPFVLSLSLSLHQFVSLSVLHSVHRVMRAGLKRTACSRCPAARLAICRAACLLLMRSARVLRRSWCP